MDFPCKALRCKLWSSSSDFETTRYQEPSLFCDVYNLMTWKECIQCDCEKQNFDPKNFNSGPSVYKTLDTMVFSTCLTDNGRIFLFSCFCYILFLEWEVLWLIFFFFHESPKLVQVSSISKLDHGVPNQAVPLFWQQLREQDCWGSSGWQWHSLENL